MKGFVILNKLGGPLSQDHPLSLLHIYMVNMENDVVMPS